MIDQVLQSRRVLTPQGMRPAAIVIQQGKIAAIAPWGEWTGEQVTDVADKLIMPGIIDPHVHINEPGRTDWEGFDTATKAAIAGGLTTVTDMPLNSSPVTTTVAAFQQKLQAAQGKLHCNCGFWGGIIPGNAGEIPGLAAAGVLGFKTFLTHSGVDEFPNSRRKDLEIAMPLIAREGLPLLVHAELNDREGMETLQTGRSYQRYLASRPARWEEDAIALMILLCEQTGCRIHIVHLSSASSLDLLNKAREKGLPVTVETAQHYLYFSAEAIPDGNMLFKCAPPIRDKENNERLWKALEDGRIDFVASDHSPAPPELKDPGAGDWMKAWGGISSLQLALPILWTAARSRKLEPVSLVKWLCEGPARLTGLERRKGKIEIDYDADFVVWDPSESFRVTEEQLFHRHKASPYVGETLFGVVHQTWIGGRKIFDGRHQLLNQGETILHRR